MLVERKIVLYLHVRIMKHDNEVGIMRGKIVFEWFAIT